MFFPVNIGGRMKSSIKKIMIGCRAQQSHIELKTRLINILYTFLNLLDFYNAKIGLICLFNVLFVK